MKNLTLRQFRYVDALARLGHFGRAAAACAISQPALSTQIKSLETALGVPLFERRSKTVQLTGFGEEFVARAREILAQVDELGALAQVAGAGLTGQLRLGIIPTIAPYLLPGLMSQLTRALPGAELHVRESQTAHLLAALEAGRLDLAILALPLGEPWLEEVPLLQEPFVLVRPADQADLAVPEPETLCHERLLLLEEGHCFRDQTLAFCTMQAAAPRKGLDGSTLSTLVQMVGAGMGVTLIPQMAVGIETKTADVAIAQFDDPAPHRTLGVVWRKTSPMGAEFRELSEVIWEVAARVTGRF